MINLCLVVIATQFSETKKRETERMAVERARRRRQSRSSSTVTSRTSVQAATAGGCYEELLAYAGYLARLAQRRAARLCRRLHCRWSPPSAATADHERVYAVTQPRRKAARRRRQRGASRRPDEAPYASPELSDIDLMASPRRPRPATKTTTTTGADLTVAVSTDLIPSPRPALPGTIGYIVKSYT